MLRRERAWIGARELSLAAWSLVCLGCGTSTSNGPLSYVEREVGEGASAERPLIVALHGRGDRPERFADVFDGFDRDARVLLVRAPIDEGRGRAWFVFRWGFERAMDDVDALLPRLARTVESDRSAHPTRGRPIVVGFSQGAMIAYAWASRRPDELRASIPISGGMPERYFPRRGARLPPIRAIHGTRDEVIEPAWSRTSVAELRARGADATLAEVEGAPHWMTPPMCEALFDALRAVLD
ncbi:MAG: alpha/beta hydrolase [Sandaracinaceae bacterium]